MNLLKTGILIFFAALGLSLNACTNGTTNNADVGDAREGTVITTKFLSTNSGTFIDPEANGEFTIKSDGTFRKLGSFQVGVQGGTVPYPTTCRYFEFGNITKVYERSAEARDQYNDYATHLMKITVTKVELDQTSKDNDTVANCVEFVREQSAKLPLYYSFYSEVISENHIRLHNSGGGDYKKGGPRTPSTLDENFYRQGSSELDEPQKPDKSSN